MLKQPLNRFAIWAVRRHRFFGDISDFKVAGQLIEAAMDNFGRIDILANIAGAFGIYPLEELTEEIWDRVTGVKPKGIFQHHTTCCTSYDQTEERTYHQYRFEGI